MSSVYCVDSQMTKLRERVPIFLIPQVNKNTFLQEKQFFTQPHDLVVLIYLGLCLLNAVAFDNIIYHVALRLLILLVQSNAY